MWPMPDVLQVTKIPDGVKDDELKEECKKNISDPVTPARSTMRSEAPHSRGPTTPPKTERPRPKVLETAAPAGMQPGSAQALGTPPVAQEPAATTPPRATATAPTPVSQPSRPTAPPRPMADSAALRPRIPVVAQPTPQVPRMPVVAHRARELQTPQAGSDGSGLVVVLQRIFKDSAVRVALEPVECAICLDPDASPQTEAAVRLACGHAFHHGCILGWARKGRDTCPTCRQKFCVDAAAIERLPAALGVGPVRADLAMDQNIASAVAALRHQVRHARMHPVLEAYARQQAAARAAAPAPLRRGEGTSRRRERRVEMPQEVRDILDASRASRPALP